MRLITLRRSRAATLAGPPQATASISMPELTHHAGPNLTPLIIALLALTALVAGPWVVSHRLARVRQELVGTTARARHLVHQTEMSLLLDAASRHEPALARLLGEMPTDTGHYDALDALAPALDTTVAGGVRRFRDLRGQWTAPGEHAGLDAGPPVGTGSAGRAVTLAAVLTAARQLDTALAEREARESAQVQSLEELDVLLPAALVPLLLGIVIAVYRVGSRMAALADEAERNRLALVRAS